MTTYKETFDKLNTAALIPFFVIGDPDFDTSLSVVKAAIDAGADILELGIPFSDPIADGPTIQKADIRALEAGMTPHKAIDFISKVTEYKPVPIGLLVYYNLIYQYGLEKFFADFKAAGGSSVLVADLSIDDRRRNCTACKSSGSGNCFHGNSKHNRGSHKKNRRINDRLYLYSLNPRCNRCKRILVRYGCPSRQAIKKSY